MTPTFMYSEIEEVGRGASPPARAQSRRTMKRSAPQLRAQNPPFVATIARGSSDHCALYLKYLLEAALGVPCASIGPSIASLYHAPLRLQGALAVSISQSGQSPDIVETQRAARRGGALTLAFVNETQSPLAEDAELLLPLWAGPERSVAATKSMIAGLVACASLVADWSGDAALKDALAGLARRAARPARAAARTASSRRSPNALFALCARPRRDLRGRAGGGAEAQGNLRDPRRGVFLGGSDAWPRRAGARGLSRASPSCRAMRRAKGWRRRCARLADAGARILRVEAGGEDGDDYAGRRDFVLVRGSRRSR